MLAIGARLSRGRFSVRLETRLILVLALGLVTTLGVAYPLVLLLINSFVVTAPYEPTRYGLEAWRFAVSDPGMLSSLWNTVRVTAAVQVISFPIALVLCWLLARTDLPGSRVLEVLFWFAFFLPVIPTVQGWILLFHPSAGLANHFLAMTLPFVERGPFDIFSYWGIVFAHLFTNGIAVKVMLLTPAFRNIDGSLEEAARVSGCGPWKMLWRITAPVVTPALASVFVMSLVRGFQSVEIELLLGLRKGFYVFGSKIFDLTRTEPPSYGGATALGVLLFAAMVPLIWSQWWLGTRRNYSTIGGRYRPSKTKLGRWKWPFFAGMALLVACLTVVPMLLLATGSLMKVYGFFDVPGGAWTTSWWGVVLHDPVFLKSMRNTLVLATVSATLSVTVVGILGYFIVRGSGKAKFIIEMVTWVPFALPGIVVFLGWLWVFLRTPFMRPLHGEIWALILAATFSTGLTVSVQLVKAALLQLSRDNEEAAAVSGAGMITTLRAIVVPLVSRTLIVVWLLNFLLASGSAIMPALLASPRSRPLALLQLEHVMSGQGEAASVVGIILVGLIAAVAVLARVVGSRSGLERVGG